MAVGKLRDDDKVSGCVDHVQFALNESMTRVQSSGRRRGRRSIPVLTNGMDDRTEGS